MGAAVNVADVRDYLTVTNTSGQWSDALIGSNIAAAFGMLQTGTGRIFEPSSNSTRTFSTLGNASVNIGGLRSTTAVTLNGATLTANQSFFLISDPLNSGVFTTIEFPAYRYGRSREWMPSQNYHGLNGFDINYNHLANYVDYSLPNDLVITGDWGHVPYPVELQLANKVLAAWLCIRPDALFSGTKQTPEGNLFDISDWPVEAKTFVQRWSVGTPQVGTAG